MRSVGISVFSLVLTTVVVANAYYQKKQFYPSVVYITKSNPSMAVIYIQAFICIWIAGKIMRKIFFGQLRTTEFEHLMERSWYAITETCLAFTVFRDDFNPKFVALFTLLLFLKSFHWLAEDRVDFMERSPVISWIYHIRVISLLLLLGSMDLYFLQHAYQSTISKGASVQLVFGFEYAILITVVFNIALKYGLHVIDLRTETPWENKAVFLLYIELVMGFIKVLLYIAFVAIMVRIYTLPLFAFRPMYYTIRNFKKAFTDVILSRRAIHNMNTQYPDITAEELAAAADTVCIICREEMTTASKKLPCNHMFHTSCLRSWFQRQQTCPTCRLDILFTNNNATRNRRARPQVQPVAPNQQQQPPQQQPQVAQPQFLNPIFAAAALFNNPGVNNNQMPPVNNGQVPNLGAAAGEQAHLPPLAFPPFPFLPFMTPPPMPAQNLRALSPEELHRLEGNERLNVEARIQCLRNIQIMLDAAVVMMQQYSAASAFSSQMPGPTETPSSSDTANHNSSAAAATTTSVETNTDSAAAAANIEEPSSSTTCNNVSKTEIDQASIATTSSTANEQVQNNLLNTPDEVRRRRLEKFQQNAEQQ